MKGNVKIELFENGKLVHEQEKHNFIAIPFKKYAEYLLRGLVVNQTPICCHTYMEELNRKSSSSGFVNYLVLTDSDMATSPTTEVCIPGNVIGYASKTETYSGDSTERGTINTSESLLGNKTAKFVFDFPTHAANGTFRSICLAQYPSPTSGYCLSVPVATDYMYSDLRELCFGGGYAWTTNGNTLYKLNSSTFEIIDSYTLTFSPTDLTYFNGSIYYTTSSYYINKFDIETEIDSNFYSTSTSRNLYGITSDSSYLYVSERDYSSIYIIDSYGVKNNEYDIGTYFSSLNYIDSDLYGMSGVALYLIDLSTSSYINTGKQIYNDGIAYDGSDMYAIKNYYNYYYNDDDYITTTGIFKVYISEGNANMASRVLLDNSVTKTDTQTMKITYTLTWS